MPNPSPEHQKLVAALVAHFKNNLGYEILSADLSGYSEPSAHGRHAPDIVAKDKNGVLHLAEAKIKENLADRISSEQLTDFSNRVMSGTDTPVFFDIIVYENDKKDLITKLNELGLGDKVGNRIKIWTL